MSHSVKTKPVNKRGAARLAAVQALYQMDLTGGRITDVVEEYEALRIGKEVDGDTYLEADLSWFRSIIAGVVKDQRSLDPAIHDALPKGWPLARIDTLLRAVMRCGTFELQNRKDVPAKVIISEYIEIAKAFYEVEEPRLVNGVLDAIARKLRPEEFDAPEATDSPEELGDEEAG